MGDYVLGVTNHIGNLHSFNHKISQPNTGLFTSDHSPPPPRTMQDETILHKTASQSQHLSPTTKENGISNGGENGLESKLDTNGSLSDDKPRTDVINSVNSAVQMRNVMEGPTTTAGVAPMPPSSTGLWANSVPEENYMQGYQSVNGTVAFQQFPPVHNNVYNGGMQTHMGGTNSILQQPPAQRRAITAQHNFPQRQQAGIILNNNSKSYPNWSNMANATQWVQHQQTPQHWGNIPNNTQHQRRSVPSFSSIPSFAFKKQTPAVSYPQQYGQTSLISPSRFRRSTSFPGQMHQAALMKPNLDMTSLDDSARESTLSYQDRSNSYDSMRFSNFETQLLDIMRATADQNDHVKAKSFAFGDYEEDGLDANIAGLNGIPRGSPGSGERIERFSRKVFVGGLPPDIDEEEITAAFRRFGALVVDWPHKAESKSYFPPKGYCFLLFQDEMSVQTLIDHCIMDDDKLYWCVSSPTMKDKPVQIRPWTLSDSDFVMDGSQPLDPRKTIFVGGVPRPLRAVELAMIMDRLYGGVCYAGIDTDPELKYPKGAGRVAFSNQQSYIAAISARFVQLQHGEIDKRVEVKPYVLDDQMCDECHGTRCGGKFAPFFCANVTVSAVLL
ncbi:hypothetical protein FSP39_019015 [Pinctada imbricata]|uniref:RRM domain-containing protein n=1 Tax=Pinctada imbricata TaxID=66713 RepID=A0AA88Y146_PINIB|nr:hypothetical protein FSP39_019015 [Pinctada imbricata]